MARALSTHSVSNASPQEHLILIIPFVLHICSTPNFGGESHVLGQAWGEKREAISLGTTFKGHQKPLCNQKKYFNAVFKK